MDQYSTDFDNFGVVDKLRLRAFQRHQNDQNPLNIYPFHGPILISTRIHFSEVNVTTIKPSSATEAQVTRW